MSVSQSFMDTAKVNLVQETLDTSEELLLLIIQAYEDESMGIVKNVVGRDSAQIHH